MTYIEAISILRTHQYWRLGASIVMFEPKIITQAIDIILSEDRYTKQEFLDSAKAGEVNMIDAKYIVSLLDELREKNNQ